MDIKNDIENQMSAGFSKEEIYSNLLQKGYNRQDIDQNYVTVSADPEVTQRYGSVSGKSIGILFLLVMVWRLARVKEGGGASNTFLIIGGITAFILAMIYFMKRE